MAKMKLQAWLSDVRGKHNGSVFSKNRFANYIRTKTTPINRDTPAQQGVRFNFADLSSGWRGITEAQRKGWAVAVPDFKRINSLADTIQLTGAQLYISLNRNLKSVGVATIDDAPSVVSVEQLTTLSVVAETTTNTIKATFTGENYTTQKYAIFATAPYSAGKSFVKNLYKLIDYAETADASPFDITTKYETVFGTGWQSADGAKISIQFLPINKTTGQAGIAQSAVSTIAP